MPNRGNYQHHSAAHPKKDYNRNSNSSRSHCFRCGFSPWSSSHRCAPGAIRSHISSRIDNGENSSYILQDVLESYDDDFEGHTADVNTNDNYMVEQECVNNTGIDHDTNNDHATADVDDNLLQEYYDEHIIEANFVHLMSPSSSIITTSHNNYINSTPNNDIPTDIIDCNEISTSTNVLLNEHFNPSFCVDSGAPRSVIGNSLLQRLQNQFNINNTNLQPSSLKFRFGDKIYDSLGTFTFSLKTPSGINNIDVPLDVVDVNIPALIGLNILDQNRLMIDNVNNKLARRRQIRKNGLTYYLEEWFLPLYRSDSTHLHTPMHNASYIDTHFTTGELNRLHRHFFHPTSTKLFNLLRRTNPADADPETLKILNDITAKCDTCQRITSVPLRFKVSFGSDSARFNERIFMDIFYITIKKCKYSILHIIDEGTHFSAATKLKNMETSTVWNALIKCWTSIYTGLPNRIIVDQGSNFGEPFIRLASLDGIQVERTGIEAHNGLSICERYHEPIRTTVRKTLLNYPKADFELVLALAVKALNDTAGPDGLVPSALLFGEFPRMELPENCGPRPTTDNRGRIAFIIRNEVRQHIDKMRISRALRLNVPKATDMIFDPGDQVLVWREKGHSNKNGEYLGPFSVSHMDRNSKLVHIFDKSDTKPRPFSITQIKHYISPSTLSKQLFTNVKIPLTQFSTPSFESDVFMTEIILQKDERSKTPEMLKARADEIKNLIKRKTFKVILKEELPLNANILPGRFVLALKSTTDGKIFHKARFVIGGHRDKLKNFMVHSSQTLQPSSIRLLLALASIFGFDVWTSDVTQAYLQSAIPLSRDLFLDSSVPELELSPHQCMKILRPLYGLS